MKKFIWLIGENLGKTLDNNSFYYWDKIVEQKDEIEKYYIVEKNKQSKIRIKSLSKEKRKYVVWKNSFKHFLLFKKADMFFVTLSYKDILPEKLLKKSLKFIIKRPLIYLQHGTLAIKKIGYRGDNYYNNIFRFLYYNKDIKERFIVENDFKEYQLYYGEFHPRCRKMIDIYLNNKDSNKKKILFFLTWREYFGDNFPTKQFINKIKQLVNNKELQDYSVKKNVEIEICLHQFYDEEKIKTIKEALSECKSNIKVVYPSEIDLMFELATCSLLVTDYSSVGFECTLLNTPVILFQPDIEEYTKNRETYYSIDEISKYSIKSLKDLIDVIISEKYEINEFFRSKLPKKINYDYLLAGKHIDRIYDYFKEKQLNRITIIGYNFTGKGGTISATKALAESLLERGYLVELLSLKMTEKKYSLPYGLAINAFYNTKQNKIVNWFKRHFFVGDKKLYYFNYDINKKMLIPYVGYALKKYLKTTSSRTIISTRESINLFVNKFTNSNVVNKLYYFHTDSRVLNDYYPNLINFLNQSKFENCIFVTEASKKAYEQDLKFTSYDNGVVIGNCLESRLMIEKKDITINKERKEIYTVSLMRLSADRKKDINNIIEFGKYLLLNNEKNIIVQIYGKGDLSNYLCDQIFKYDIDDIVKYMGATDNPQSVILDNDCVIDFCENQSFGMPYIESILNGKPVFAKENIGSLEVLKSIPDAYYHSNKELREKVLSVKSKKVSDYKKNYDIISNKYSRKKVSEEIIKLIK